MSKKTLYATSAIIAVLAPAVVFAQTNQTLSDVIVLVVRYLNQFMYLLMAVAVVLFVFYVIKYFVVGSEGGESRKEGGKYVLWSIVGFFVILSVWGLVNILTNTFNTGGSYSSSPTWSSLGNIFPR